MRRIAAALGGACVVGADAASAGGIAAEEVAELQGLKRGIYDAFTRAHAQEVAEGSAQPIVYTAIGGGELPVSYYHYRIPRPRLAALAEALSLPPAFSLAPLRILRHERPRHTLSLTVYEVAGERRGLRAEWTTYVVRAGDPRPRVMMLETWSSQGSVDPVDLLSEATDRFEYRLRGGAVTTQIAQGSSSFAACFELPRHPRRRRLDPSWNAASDRVYWRNGVADLLNVNALVSNRRLVSLPPRRLHIENRSRWADYTEPRPRLVLLFDERVDTTLRPWVNLGDPELPLEADFRERLVATKASLFSENERKRAAAIAEGEAEPVADFFIQARPPSVFLNFEIRPERRAELVAKIPLPEGFRLARIQPLRGGVRRYFLSLNVYEARGLAPGFRAEWSVYVTKEGDPVPRYMILEAQSSTPSLDPVDRFTQPAELFDYALEGGILRIDVQAPGTSFQAHVELPRKPRRRATSLDWTEANNLIYWRNGVADKIYYSGLVYDRKLVQVPKRLVSVTDATVWAPYLRLEQVLVFENPLEFIASPWCNLDPLEAELGEA